MGQAACHKRMDATAARAGRPRFAERARRISGIKRRIAVNAQGLPLTVTETEASGRQRAPLAARLHRKRSKSEGPKTVLSPFSLGPYAMD